MVGNRPMSPTEKPKESLAEALQRVYPELRSVSETATEPVFLVGGAVRDLLLGRGRADIDLVVEGDAAALAVRLGADVVSHERFATAKVSLDGHEIDIATARTERYQHPGSLPVVEPAAGVEASPALAEEILAFCRDKLAKYKTPKSIDFIAEMPRDPNGKLYKRKLRDPYWVGRERKI